jgi:hypothetical protein
MQYPHFFIWVLQWANGGVGCTNDQASRYGWVVCDRYLPRWLVGTKMNWHLLFDANNTCIWVVAIIFHLGITGGLCEQIQGKCNTYIFFIWTLWWANWGVGRTNDYASRYGWVVFGRYLLGWLTCMIMKWWLLFDASNIYIRIATIIFIWALQVVCVNKSNGNAILSSDFVIWWCHVDCNTCI